MENSKPQNVRAGLYVSFVSVLAGMFFGLVIFAILNLFSEFSPRTYDIGLFGFYFDGEWLKLWITFAAFCFPIAASALRNVDNMPTVKRIEAKVIAASPARLIAVSREEHEALKTRVAALEG